MKAARKIFAVEEITRISEEICKQGKRIVVVGGCFDLLHDGHKVFLKKAKEQGDFLMVLVESDERVKAMKGNDRPFCTLEQRAEELARLDYVDYVIPLPYIEKNDGYDSLISCIKPAIIATTKGDPGRYHKERQANLFGAQVVDVIARIPDLSTTLLAHNRIHTKT